MAKYVPSLIGRFFFVLYTIGWLEPFLGYILQSTSHYTRVLKPTRLSSFVYFFFFLWLQNVITVIINTMQNVQFSDNPAKTSSRSRTEKVKTSTHIAQTSVPLISFLKIKIDYCSQTGEMRDRIVR